MKAKNKSYLFAILTVCMWGTTFALSKFLVPDPLSTITFTAIRTLLGFITIIIYFLASGSIRAWWVFFRSNWKYLSFLGVCLYSVSYMVQYLGIQYTDAMNQAIISNTIPFWVVMWNFLVFRRKPDRRFFPAAFIAFIGVVLIEISGTFDLQNGNLLGDLISIGAFALWGAYNVAARKILEDNDPIYVTGSLLFTATIFMVPFSLINGAIPQILSLDGVSWLLLMYLGVAAIGLAFILWNTALSNKNVPSENISLIIMLNPVVGILTSLLFLGEQMTVQKFLGCVFVFSAIFIVNYRKNRKNKKKNAHSAVITFHELSCYEIRETMDDGSEICVVFDPHDGDSLGLTAPSIGNADVVLCSHSHYDHNAGKNLVAGEDALVLDEETGDFEHKGVKIHGTRTKHGEWEDWGHNVVYSVKFPSGLVVIHGGDMGFVPTVAQAAEMRSLGNIALAILPIGGKFCLNARQALDTAELLNPRITTVVTHYLYGPLLEKEDFQGMKTEEPFIELVGNELEQVESKSIGLNRDFKKFILFISDEH